MISPYLHESGRFGTCPGFLRSSAEREWVWSL